MQCFEDRVPWIAKADSWGHLLNNSHIQRELNSMGMKSEAVRNKNKVSAVIGKTV